MALTGDKQLIYKLPQLSCFQNLMQYVSCHIYQAWYVKYYVTQFCMYITVIYIYSLIDFEKSLASLAKTSG